MSARAWPLQWPDGWDRTPEYRRQRAPYKVTPDRATQDLLHSLELLGAQRGSVVISSNIPLKRDGFPRADARTPEDPGIAVFWSMPDHPESVMACDRWRQAHDNIRAIGLAVEGLRSIKRAGASQILTRAFTAFGALPPASRWEPSRHDRAQCRNRAGSSSLPRKSVSAMNKLEKPIIRSDSPEAASIQTVTGWVSSNGRFWGEDERMARYDGSTHHACEQCGTLVENNYIKCPTCRASDDLEKFAKLERAPWDGEQMLFSEALDRYFSGPEAAIDHAQFKGIAVSELRLVLCDPQYLSRIETDVWSEELPGDGDDDLPGDVEAALELLNEAIEKAGPVSWIPGDKAWDGKLDGG